MYVLLYVLLIMLNESKGRDQVLRQLTLVCLSRDFIVHLTDCSGSCENFVMDHLQTLKYWILCDFASVTVLEDENLVASVFFLRYVQWSLIRNS